MTAQILGVARLLAAFFLFSSLAVVPFSFGVVVGSGAPSAAKDHLCHRDFIHYVRVGQIFGHSNIFWYKYYFVTGVGFANILLNSNHPFVIEKVIKVTLCAAIISIVKAVFFSIVFGVTRGAVLIFAVALFCRRFIFPRFLRADQITTQCHKRLCNHPKFCSRRQSHTKDA